MKEVNRDICKQILDDSFELYHQVIAPATTDIVKFNDHDIYRRIYNSITCIRNVLVYCAIKHLNIEVKNYKEMVSKIAIPKESKELILLYRTNPSFRDIHDEFYNLVNLDDFAIFERVARIDPAVYFTVIDEECARNISLLDEPSLELLHLTMKLIEKALKHHTEVATSEVKSS